MPDFSTMTNDDLLNRLGELERELDEPTIGASMARLFDRLYLRMKEATLIQIELARRTATGWRPM